MQRRRKTENEKEDNFWRRKIFFWRGQGKGGQFLEKESIVLRRRRKRRTIFGEGKCSFAEEKKNRERKGGKSLAKENILFAEEKKRRKISFAEEKKTEKEKEENIWRRKIFVGVREKTKR